MTALLLKLHPILEVGFGKNDQGLEFGLSVRTNPENNERELWCVPHIQLESPVHANSSSQSHSQNKELPSTLSQLLPLATSKPDSCTPTCTAALKQLQEIGWEKIIYLSDDLTQAHIRFVDAGRRRITLKISLHRDFPVTGPQFAANIPTAFEFPWSERSHLSEVLEQFSQLVEDMQPFWEEMEDLDQRVWVLYPAPVTLADKTRRIGLTNHTNIEITVNPDEPRALPTITFVGDETEANAFKDKLNENSDKWDENRPIIDNLKDVLDVSFPEPSSSQRSDVVLDCLICQSSTDDGPEQRAPDIICGRCRKIFHQMCIYKWLSRQAKPKMRFGYLLGTCPHCKKVLKVKIPRM